MRHSEVGTTIVVSAQFGGRDAADAVRPHFYAMKRAAQGLVLAEFPEPELSFILRVDGEIMGFDEPGLSNLDLAPGEYISVDIVLSIADREQLNATNGNPIVRGIVGTHQFFCSKGIDIGVLPEQLRDFADRYMHEVKLLEQTASGAT